MNYINFSDNNMNLSNDIGSIGTEYSEINNFNNYAKKNNLFGGVLNEDLDELTLCAAREGEFGALSFLIRKNKMPNLKKQDKSNGYTVLHYVVTNYSNIPKNDQVLDIILNNKDIGSFINIQDKINGNTPLHIATSRGNNDVVEKLILKGADKTILNDNKEYIGTDHEDSLGQINKSNVSNAQNSEIFIKKKNLDQQMDHIINLFLGPKINKENKVSEASLRMTDAMKEYKNSFQNGQNRESESPNINNTSELIDDIIKKHKQQYDIQQKGGNINKKTKQNINGKRVMKTNSDFELKGGNSDISTTSVSNINSEHNSDSNDKKYDNLSRLLQNQSDIIHKRTIEKIKDLLDIDEEKAKIYKAAIYQKVKTEHPELNNYDRAVEMEKIATTENLKKINFEEWNQKIKESKESKKDNKQREQKRTAPSDTSSMNSNSETSDY